MSPEHYVPIGPDSQLQQGDIIDKSPSVVGALEKALPEDALRSASALIILTQTCDLVRRNGKPCKAKHISLATVSSLEESLFTLLDDTCEKPHLKEDTSLSGVYFSKDQFKAKQLLERIINQTEEDRGLFYLPPNADAGIAVHSIAHLRIHATVSVGHYDSLVKNLRGRLRNEYQNRLGWLVGNLFSRVAVPEFSKEEKESIIGEFLKQQDKETGPFWVSQDAVGEARRHKLDTNGKTPLEIYELIKSVAPPPPKERAIACVESIIKEEVPAFSRLDLEKVSRRLANDGVFAKSIRNPEEPVAR